MSRFSPGDRVHGTWCEALYLGTVTRTRYDYAFGELIIVEIDDPFVLAGHWVFTIAVSLTSQHNTIHRLEEVAE